MYKSIHPLLFDLRSYYFKASSTATAQDTEDTLFYYCQSCVRHSIVTTMDFRDLVNLCVLTRLLAIFKYILSYFYINIVLYILIENILTLFLFNNVNDAMLTLVYNNVKFSLQHVKC